MKKDISIQKIYADDTPNTTVYSNQHDLGKHIGGALLALVEERLNQSDMEHTIIVGNDMERTEIRWSSI